MPEVTFLGPAGRIQARYHKNKDKSEHYVDMEGVVNRIFDNEEPPNTSEKVIAGEKVIDDKDLIEFNVENPT